MKQENKWKERLQLISDHIDGVNSTEKTYLIMLHKAVQAREESYLTKQELLQNELFAKSDLMQKRLELRLLQNMLSNFFGERGLRHSSFTIEELQHLISHDLSQLNDQYNDKMDTIRGIRQLLNQLPDDKTENTQIKEK